MFDVTKPIHGKVKVTSIQHLYCIIFDVAKPIHGKIEVTLIRHIYCIIFDVTKPISGNWKGRSYFNSTSILYNV